MKRWRKAFMCAGLVAIAAGFGFVAWRRHVEPAYQGKTTAQWFREFLSARTPQLVTIPSQGVSISSQLVTIRTQSRIRVLTPLGPSLVLVDARSRGLEGLRALGTNAVPYLAAEVRRREPIWERVYSSVFSKTPPTVRKMLPPPVPREVVREAAASAIAALGANGASAAPALLEGLKFCGPTSEGSILYALERLPYSSRDAEEILEFFMRQRQYGRVIKLASSLWIVSPGSAECLVHSLSSTNAVDRRACAHQLRYFARYASLVLPGVVRALNDPDREVRLAAARVLEDFEGAAAPALPALEQSIRSDDSELRYLSARALEAMGTNAAPVVPLLIQATNDSFVPVRTVARRILNKLGANSR